MFWLTRPPYLRWAAAGTIVLSALAWDLSGRRTEPFPFAAADVAAGQPITEEDVAWRPVPRGLMEMPDLSSPTAGRDIERGEPITTGAVATASSIPEGWWAVPMAVPVHAAPGTAVRLVVLDPPATVDGVVVTPGERDLLSIADAGLVAVPPEMAETVARAAVEGTVVLLVRP